MLARYQGYHRNLGYHFTRCSLVLRKPLLIHFYVVWCGYSSASFESYVWRHLVIVPVRRIKKLPLSACPSTPQGNQYEMLHFVPSMGPCNLCINFILEIPFMVNCLTFVLWCGYCLVSQIFCITSFGDRSHPRHQETTMLP